MNVRTHLGMRGLFAVLACAILTLGLAPAAFGQATAITSTGFRASEGGGGALTTEWTTGNLGNTWAEGEWVPYQLIISNVQTSYPNLAGFPNIVMEYDFTAQNDARFVDLVRSVQAGTTQLTNAQGWPRDNGTAYPMTTRTQIEQAQNDFGNTAPLENTWPSFAQLNLPEAQVNRAAPPGFAVGSPTDQFRYFYITRQNLIDAGIPLTANTIVIYYQLHESRSFIWFNGLQAGYDAPPTDEWGGYIYGIPPFSTDSRNGSGYVPGSSGQLRVSFGGGDKTVPIPIPERLPGAVSGLKWHDIDGDGVQDVGEPTLSGWQVFVRGSLEGIFFSDDTLTDGSGNYSFPNLTSNVIWDVYEASQRDVPATDGWNQTYPSAGTVVGVGTGFNFGFVGDTAAVGWKVALTEAVSDQANMNFGNRQCQVVIQCPPDVNRECDLPVDPSSTGYPTVIIGNCGPLDTSYTDNVLRGVCGVNGYVAQIERTWIVGDNAGNADTCVQYITQVDTTPPILPTPPADQTLSCDADLSPPDLNPPTDNCDPEPTFTVRQDIISGDCPQSYTIVNWWKAVDACGNADSVSQTVTVVDDEPPVLAGCPQNATYQCLADVSPPATVTATDNCDPDVVPVFSEVQSNPGSSCNNIITRKWVATDDCGNKDSCMQTITVNDNTAPVLAGCPNDASYQCIDDVPGPANVTATDNCDPSVTVEYSQTQSNPGSSCNNVIIRKWVATDDCGNKDSCMQTITVDDTTPPVLAGCPNDASFQCYSTVPGPANVTATDNCDPSVTIEYSESQSNPGSSCNNVITRTWVAIDDCDNRASCTQTIRVNDNTAPVLSGCPEDLSFECRASEVPPPAVVTALDNCDGAIRVDFSESESNPGASCNNVITRTWVATDACGNSSSCSQQIRLSDATPPVLAGCPNDASYQCLSAVPGPANVTATDNCDPSVTVEYSESQSNPGSSCNNIITRTWVATDGCGNQSRCVQRITVNDTTPPVLAGCPNDASYQCIDDVPGPANVTATDNCDPSVTVEYSESQSNPGSSCNNTITRTWVATDDCGNRASCTQTIRVNDTTPPVLAGCPNDASYQCLSAVPGPANVTATDNCDPSVTLQYSESQSNPGSSCNNVITRTWVAIDDCDNTASCTQTIRVNDNTPPVLTCAADDSVECDQEVIFTPPSVSDNCDPSPIVSIISTVETPGPGQGEITHTRTWGAADVCGNQAIECSQSIIVLACPDTGCTFTQGGWGSMCPKGQQGNPKSTQPGCIRDNYFSQIFPAGVSIGDASGFRATWTSSAAVEAYLPAGGTPRPLSQNYTNPTSTSAGVLGGQVLALTLNVAYSCGGAFADLGLGGSGFCYGTFTIPDYCGKFAGISVQEFLDIANLVLSGDASAASGYNATWSDINFTATCLNELFDDCDPNAPTYSLVDLAKAGLILGDVNYDGRISSSDLVYLSNYVFSAGPTPKPILATGNVYWDDQKVTSLDVVYLADWLLKQPVLGKPASNDQPDIK